MPERNFLSDADYTARRGTTTEKRLVPYVLGMRKYILSLNNKGVFIPGTYRCNGNRIFEVSARCEATLARQVLYGSEYELSGKIAAQLFGQSIATCLGDLTPQWDGFLECESINKSYARIVNNDLDVGVMIGELRETIEGLRNPLSALRKQLTWASRNQNRLLNLERALNMARGYERIRITDSIDRLTKRFANGIAPKTANALAGTWLEWRYGIRPLIKQCQDVYEHVMKQSRSHNEKMQSKKGKTSTVVSVVPGTASTSAVLFNVYGSYTKTTSTWTTAKTTFTMPLPLTWQFRYGTDYSSIPSIAWELLPLSFVADWFVSFGTWLSALRVLATSATIHGTSVTQRSDITVEGTITSVKLGDNKLELITPGSYHWQLRSMQRKCLSPGFKAYTPSLNSRALGLQREIDALALTWQRLPSLKPFFSRRN